MTGVTIALSRRLRPGTETAFELWLKDISAAVARYPGYLGATVLRPASPAADTNAAERTTVLRFEDEACWRRWKAAPEPVRPPWRTTAWRHRDGRQGAGTV